MFLELKTILLAALIIGQSGALPAKSSGSEESVTSAYPFTPRVPSQDNWNVGVFPGESSTPASYERALRPILQDPGFMSPYTQHAIPDQQNRPNLAPVERGAGAFHQWCSPSQATVQPHPSFHRDHFRVDQQHELGPAGILNPFQYQDNFFQDNPTLQRDQFSGLSNIPQLSLAANPQEAYYGHQTPPLLPGDVAPRHNIQEQYFPSGGHVVGGVQCGSDGQLYGLPQQYHTSIAQSSKGHDAHLNELIADDHFFNQPLQGFQRPTRMRGRPAKYSSDSSKAEHHRRRLEMRNDTLQHIQKGLEIAVDPNSILYQREVITPKQQDRRGLRESMKTVQSSRIARNAQTGHLTLFPAVDEDEFGAHSGEGFVDEQEGHPSVSPSEYLLNVNHGRQMESRGWESHLNSAYHQ